MVKGKCSSECLGLVLCPWVFPCPQMSEKLACVVAQIRACWGDTPPTKSLFFPCAKEGTQLPSFLRTRRDALKDWKVSSEGKGNLGKQQVIGAGAEGWKPQFDPAMC